jgi:FtsZ-interacting cell division protein ZipA
MFGFIKKIFGGIVGLITGLFGSKKNSKKKGGFFMELEEGEKDKSKNSSQPALAAKTEAKAEEAKAALSQATKEVKAAPAKTAKQAKAALSNNAKAESPKPEPVAVAPAPSKPQPQAATTFAPNYLIAPSTGSSRRRPGPSLKEFQTMARQLKSS